MPSLELFRSFHKSSNWMSENLPPVSENGAFVEPPVKPLVTFRRAVMCYPKDFKVAFKINPWMGGVVDLNLARRQWQTLKKTLESCGIEVLVMDQAKGHPDSVFCCDAGFALGNKVFLANPRFPERQTEREHYKKWFSDRGFEVLEGQHFFEGGDARMNRNGALFVGNGFRSESRICGEIAKSLFAQEDDLKVVPCELTSDLFYHLDVCYAPLDSQTSLYYPPAFSAATIAEMSKHVRRLIPVSRADAFHFSCNAICIPERKTVVLPAGLSGKLEATLTQLGYDVIQVDVSEFLKGGGATHCMVFEIFERI